MGARTEKLRRALNLERKTLDLFKVAMDAVDERGHQLTYGEKVVTRARVAEVFMILADVLEEEGDFDLSPVRRLVEGEP